MPWIDWRRIDFPRSHVKEAVLLRQRQSETSDCISGFADAKRRNLYIM